MCVHIYVYVCMHMYMHVYILLAHSTSKVIHKKNDNLPSKNHLKFYTHRNCYGMNHLTFWL
jgi:hypothetical protein